MKMVGKRILVVAPHADDEWFSCGGTLMKWGPNNVILPVLVVAGVFRLMASQKLVPWQTRVDEFSSAARFYTRENPIVLIKDKQKNHIKKSSLNQFPINNLILRMDKVVMEFKPDVMIIPGLSHHQDHLVARQACFACMRQSSPQSVSSVLAYEEIGCAWSLMSDSFRPNVFVDISDVLDKKMEVYNEVYVSQASKADRQAYSEGGLVAHANFRGKQCRKKYAEAFMLLKGMME